MAATVIHKVRKVMHKGSYSTPKAVESTLEKAIEILQRFGG
jgi:hypothetical protein